jgi:chromosome segregation ATPase
MSDQPLTLGVLAEFHRAVILPDVQRVVQELVTASERRMMTHIDGLAHRLQDLKMEVAATSAGLARVEERLGAVELRLDRVEQRLDLVEQRLDRVEQRLDGVEQRLDRVEHRLDGVESRLSRVDAPPHQH